MGNTFQGMEAAWDSERVGKVCKHGRCNSLLPHNLCPHYNFPAEKAKVMGMHNWAYKYFPDSIACLLRRQRLRKATATVTVTEMGMDK